MRVAWLFVVLIALFSGTVAARQTSPAQKPIRLLVVTGGHDYDTGFYTLFQGYDDLKWDHSVHKAAADGYRKDMAAKYDALVLYDMPKEITDEQKQRLLGFLKAGHGVVVLHHAIVSFPGWPEFAQLAGGKYFEKAEGEHGASSYAHDQELKIHVADATHPITRGLRDFVVNDEGYKNLWVSPDAHLLLTTGHPRADRQIAWISSYPGGRVVTILLGHGEGAYSNPNFRRLLIQAIRWAAARP